MGEQSPESLSVLERVPLVRYAYVLLLLVIPTTILWISWNDIGGSTSVLHQRIFLVGVALVWAVGAVTLVLVPWWEETRAWLIAAHLVIMGLYIGLAIATTDWNAWPMRQWWQGWWTPWFVAGQIQHVLRLLRSGAHPLRSLQPLKA